MKELKLILIDSGNGALRDLEKALAGNERLGVVHVRSPEQVFDKIEDGQFDAVIVDEEVQGTTGLKLVRELVRRNPFINCALVSSLYPSEFHEATEGLGVFMQLPMNPGPKEAQKIYDHLEKIC